MRRPWRLIGLYLSHILTSPRPPILFRPMVCFEISKDGHLWPYLAYILFKGYRDLRCKVRFDNKLSEWFPMTCRIHQGGVLSLMKYIAFINEYLYSWSAQDFVALLITFRADQLGVQMTWLLPLFQNVVLMQFSV